LAKILAKIAKSEAFVLFLHAGAEPVMHLQEVRKDVVFKC